VAAVDDSRTVPTRGVLLLVLLVLLVLLLPARRFGRRRFRLDKAWNVVVQVQSAHGNVVGGGATAAAPTGWHLRR
jgi:predicted permease